MASCCCIGVQKFLPAFRSLSMSGFKAMSSQPLDFPASVESSLQLCVQTVLLLQRRATLRHLRVHVDGDVVELSGTVPTFYDRQVAVTACRRMERVREVRDRIEVVAPSHAAAAPRDGVPVEPLSASSGPPSVAPHVHATAGNAAEPPACSGWWATSLRVALAALVFCASGCKEASTTRLPVFPVTGRVVFKDKPLENALVVLHPKAAAGSGVLPARATTDREGNFQLATYDAKDGAIAGEYVITIQHFPLVKKGESFEPGPNSLPPKLAKPETSDLPVVKVADGPVDVGVLKIKG